MKLQKCVGEERDVDKEEAHHQSLFSIILTLRTQTHLLGGKANKQAGYSNPSKLKLEFLGSMQCTRSAQVTKEERKERGTALRPCLPYTHAMFFLEKVGERELWTSYYLRSLVILLQGLIHGTLDRILHHAVALHEDGTETSGEQSVDS